jgi:hypothetical protein
MTMEPWWCSRESKGLRPLAWLRLPRRFRWHIFGAAVFLMAMRRPLRMAGGIFAAFDCRALPRLIRVRELFRAFLSGICWGKAVASLRTVRHFAALPGRDLSPIHRLELGCPISSFLPPHCGFCRALISVMS